MFSSTRNFPQLSDNCRVFYSDGLEYKQNAYQYSYSSHDPETMKPNVIVYPENIDDVIKVVNYARDSGLGVAVRTGGHQYSGASSTSGENILVDMSDTFQSKSEDFRYEESTGILRVGISFSLLEFNNGLRKLNMFMPHGQCCHVHVGGHCQSGGYGQLGRAWGLFCDHVEAFEIVLADGTHQKIWRPNHPLMTTPQGQDKDELFWAVLGGSPGNYGILTHLYIRPMHDKDYPDSRGMKLFSRYTKSKLERCLQLLAEMSDDPDFPRDFDLCCTVMTDVANAWYFKHAFNVPGAHREETIDERMMLHHPEEYGDGVPTAEDAKLAIPLAPTPVILVYAQWANTGGLNQKFGDRERQWFERIRDSLRPNIFDSPVTRSFSALKTFVQGIVDDEEVPNYSHLDYNDYTPMSELTRYWVYDDVREYVKPYEKRTYVSDKTDLSRNGWAEWVSGRINEIVKGDDDRLKCVVQIQPFGGNNSMYRRYPAEHPEYTSHSWRNETTMVQVLDCFYDPTPDNSALKKAMAWQTGNDQGAMEGGIFCNKDRRVLWGSYARDDDPDAGAKLPSVRDKYYDSEDRYQKLVSIKRRFDPNYVFTANTFGIDADNAPIKNQVLIKGLGH